MYNARLDNDTAEVDDKVETLSNDAVMSNVEVVEPDVGLEELDNEADAEVAILDGEVAFLDTKVVALDDEATMFDDKVWEIATEDVPLDADVTTLDIEVAVPDDEVTTLDDTASVIKATVVTFDGVGMTFDDNAAALDDALALEVETGVFDIEALGTDAMKTSMTTIHFRMYFFVSLAHIFITICVKFKIHCFQNELPSIWNRIVLSDYGAFDSSSSVEVNPVAQPLHFFTTYSHFLA